MRYGLALLDVEKPGRYEGLEAGAVVKDWAAARVRVALCFPDVYEIGMSHLGLPVLYEALNRRDGVLAERAYAPWPDMEALLRRHGWPLVARESGRALREFDLVGFTLPYELLATNVLAMLDLGGVPLLARDRGEADPLVIAGGPITANPEPLADFFDALFVGEGEDGAVEIVEALSAAISAGADRSSRLAALSQVPGVYVPGTARPIFQAGRLAGFDPPARVRRRVVADLETAVFPERPLVPFIGTVHERLAVELARGCTRGCRFCQAGFLYRPVRERSPERVQDLVARGLATTGYEEVGLLSLSTGDYDAIGPLLVRLMEAHARECVAVSLPSLRVDSLDGRLLEEVGRVRKTGFTVAPEAGTERLRRVVNKNITEDDVLQAAEKIFSAGWKGLKLYFMIGLPTETREDWEGIVDLARKVARLAPGGRGRVSVSISNFVPKPHTPFQWCRQLEPGEVETAQEYFKEALRDRKIDLKWHNAHMSALEGVFSRGDRRVGRAVLAAYRKGCRMDGWSDAFRWDLWQEALSEAGLSLGEFLRERDVAEPLPWDVVDLGVERTFFRREWESALRGGMTGDCRSGNCQGCGLCDFQAILPRVSGPRDFPPCVGGTHDAAAPEEDPSRWLRLRFRFRKTGPASLLSHLETVAALHRAFRAVGVAIAYSRGFHPHPRLTLGPALSLGTESLCELGDLKVREVPQLAEAQAALNRNLPEGLRVEALWTLVPDSRGLTGGDTREDYRVWPSPAASAAVAALDAKGWESAVERFWRAASFPVTKRRRNKPDRVLEGREYVEALCEEGGVLGVRVRRGKDGTTLGIEDLVRALSALPEGERASARILKTRVELS